MNRNRYQNGYFFIRGNMGELLYNQPSTLPWNSTSFHFRSSNGYDPCGSSASHQEAPSHLLPPDPSPSQTPTPSPQGASLLVGKGCKGLLASLLRSRRDALCYAPVTIYFPFPIALTTPSHIALAIRLSGRSARENP